MDNKQNRPQVGVGVFVFKEGKILLGKRKGSHGADQWAAPGGHLEFGESVQDCAIRELMEETGLKALSLVTGGWSSNVIDGNRHYITLFVTVNQFEGTPEALEPHKCEAWGWFALDSLPSPLFAPVSSFFTECQ